MFHRFLASIKIFKSYENLRTTSDTRSTVDRDSSFHNFRYTNQTKAIMNVNKKLGRFKQWAGERMGQEAKTSVSDDFKSLEVEMALRHEGSTTLPSRTVG